MNSPAPDAGPEFDLRAYLLGAWSVERTLLDRASGTRGSFAGAARFTETGDGGGLHFHEEGTVSWTSYNGGPFTGPASRDYLLRPTDARDTLDMFFPDGRPFHRMGFSERSRQDRHWCDPDTYKVSYTMIGPHEFRYRWDVTGPVKDQLLESVLHRRPGSPT
ncbi:hypothetical protein E5206_18730 [Arthrobacter sp. PAMC25564]|uniref:DUF6314 family protein n=1 Tax=Arthrobacter sp. PAMC25564 TaxID=2565366 RepID=UPI0010A1FC80|nr:DUF6314 family protein [Arthrobacter sp. PAMC25564]QCB98692.1 hypothetical protein E5206_18730 [Arthrobacter sp. PAMC25564]